MIKTLAATILAAITLASCNNFSKHSKDNSFGESFDTTGSISVAQLLATKPSNTLVKGTITCSCKSEGCWLKLDAGNGEELFVTTEENFFIPVEGMEGKTVLVKGETFTDTIPVEELRHLAADEGKTEAEIEAINDPKVEVSLRATGVKVL